MNFLEARQSRRWMTCIGDGIAHLHFQRAFDIRCHVTGFPHFQFFSHVRFGVKAADLLYLHIFSRVEQFDLHASLQLAVKHAHVCHHSFIGVKIRIESQGLHGRRSRRFRRRNPFHDRFQNFVNANSFLGAGQDRRLAGNRQDIFQLLLRLRHIRVRQIDFVDHRNDGQILFHRQMHIGDGLRLDALRGIDNQQCPFARAEAARDLI